MSSLLSIILYLLLLTITVLNICGFVTFLVQLIHVWSLPPLPKLWMILSHNSLLFSYYPYLFGAITETIHFKLTAIPLFFYSFSTCVFNWSVYDSSGTTVTVQLNDFSTKDKGTIELEILLLKLLLICVCCLNTFSKQYFRRDLPCQNINVFFLMPESFSLNRWWLTS